MPAAIVAGSKSPAFTGLGPLQPPPASGAPPNRPNSRMDGPPAQSVLELGEPALGRLESDTETVAVDEAHGALPPTV